MASPAQAWTFRPLTEPDIPLLHDWLSRPHVARWWKSDGTPEGTMREFTELLELHCGTRAYIASWDGQPAAFVQCYRVMGAGGGWWESETDPGARGVDLFIGEERLLGGGRGTALIESFVSELFRDPAVNRVQADPAPQNLRAIRAYCRAGFCDCGVITTPDGEAVLLVQTRSARRDVD